MTLNAGDWEWKSICRPDQAPAGPCLHGLTWARKRCSPSVGLLSGGAGLRQRMFPASGFRWFGRGAGGGNAAHQPRPAPASPGPCVPLVARKINIWPHPVSSEHSLCSPPQFTFLLRPSLPQTPKSWSSPILVSSEESVFEGGEHLTAVCWKPPSSFSSCATRKGGWGGAGPSVQGPRS